MDLCIFRYLTNNKKLFIENLKIKFLDFTIASSQTIKIKSIGTIAILIINRIIRLENIIYISDYNTNFIFQAILQK